MSSTDEKTFPFTKEHIVKFKSELEKAGGFDKLMLRKKALKEKSGIQEVRVYQNIERYKRKYLLGVYESLRPMYDTEMPYVFWSALYEVISGEDRKDI